MKFIRNNENISIFVSNDYLQFDESKIENYLMEIFNKLKKFYFIKIIGYYHINLYIDKLFGIIIDMFKETDDYDDENQIDMEIKIFNDSFLYKIEDNSYFELNNENIILYFYENNIYVNIINELDNKLMINILEHSTICYKDNNKIINYGKIIKI
ncbi:MAG: hypothetical protein PHN42_00030 [Bacilli bacterium]|nr:hypothetical protein [Bacilli bacterium]